jgi:hypothetical protein
LTGRTRLSIDVDGSVYVSSDDGATGWGDSFNALVVDIPGH